MSLKKPKPPAPQAQQVQAPPPVPAPPSPHSPSSPTAINDVVRDVISKRRRQATLLASAPTSSGAGKTLLGSGIA